MTALPVERHPSMTPRPHPDPAGSGAPDRECAQRRLPARPTAPSAGRRFVTAHLRKWGLDALAEACELVASELVTNAVTAIRGQSDLHRRANPSPEAAIILRLRLTGRQLRLEVWDGDERPPVPAPTSGTAAPDGVGEHGRGLQLVAALCGGWTYRTDPDGGKVVLAWWDLY